MNKLEEKNELLKKFISKYTTKSATDWFVEGDELIQQGNYAEAIHCYDKALAIDPKFEGAWYTKGIALSFQGNYAEAIHCYDKALAIDPKFEGAWYAKGIALSFQGNYMEAMHCYDKTLAINPKYKEAWYGKGIALSHQGNYVEAIQCYDKALAIDPKFKEAWNNKGPTMFCQDPSAVNVLDYFEKALEIDSKNVSALQGKAIVYTYQGKSAEANRLFEQVVQLMKGEENKEKVANMFCMRGEMFFAIKNFEVAQTAFDQALASAPHNLRAKQGLAKVLDVIAKTNTSSRVVQPSQQLAMTTRPNPTGALVLDDYHQAISRIAEQERQAFLGLLQTDYQNLYAEYQRLGQQGFENNFQSQQHQFAKYLASQQLKLQSQGAEQQSQFADTLQTVLSQYPNQSMVSLSENVLQEVQKQLQTKLGPNFISSMENLLNSQSYQEEVQRMQQGILQRIQERQGQMAMEMIHVQQKQQKIKNEHDPLFKEYQAQQQKLAEQNELQKQASVRAFYNTIEKVLGSRLMSAMSLASGMIVRVTTKSENRVEMAANIVGKIVDLIPAIGSVANSVIGAGIAIGQTIHGKQVDKKQEAKFKNTLDSMIRLEDALALAELVARRLAQSYLKHIAENYLSVEETTAAGENAANIVYGCIKSGGLKEYATKSLDEKVTHLVNVVNAEAQKQKGTFFRKAVVFKEPASAQISTATRKQVHALGEDLSKVQEQNELAAKQAQMKLQQMEKEQAEMKAEFARMKQMQGATSSQATPQFLPPPPSPLQRTSSPSFFKGPTTVPITISLLAEETWSVGIEQLRQSNSSTLFTAGHLQIQRVEKKLTLSIVSAFPNKERAFEKLGESIQKMFSEDLDDWEVENEVISITTKASQKAKKLESFLGQAFAIKAPASPSVSTRAEGQFSMTGQRK